MNTRNLALLIFSMSILTSPSFAQEKIGSSPCVVDYENHNQTDYSPLVVHEVKGLVTDRQGSAVANECLALFTETDHKLFATTVIDPAGEFLLQNIPPGRYRMVVKADALCTANVPLRIVKNRKKAKMVHVHMEPRGLDSCSYAALESDASTHSQNSHIP